MGIKRFVASQDNEIVNAYKTNLTQRATGSNMGAADVVSVFSIYAQATTSSMELSRILMQFPISDIEDAIASGEVDSNANFYLRLFNAPHSDTVPRNFTLDVQNISSSWTEGDGLDTSTYLDIGVSNWISSSDGNAWVAEGGDYVGTILTASFDIGTEDLELDITDFVNDWLDGTSPNYGVGIRLSSAYESGTVSYYTKKFFARGSEFFYKRPVIEARWDSSVRDHRGSFYISSSLSPDNDNNLYLYNYVRGRLTNIPGIETGSIYVSLYDAVSGGTNLTPTVITGGYVTTGTYSASVELYTTASVVYDRWYNSGLSVCYFTGSVSTKPQTVSDVNFLDNYVFSPLGMKTVYPNTGKTRIRVAIRPSEWQPTLYTVSSTDLETSMLDNVYYRIIRIADNYDVVSYGTGSEQHTKLSYDVSGNYFDVDLSMLESGYSYGIRFTVYDGYAYKQQPEVFKFRVEER